MRWSDTHAARFHSNTPGVETGNDGKRNWKPNRFHPSAWPNCWQITRLKETGWKSPLETKAHFNGGVSSALVSRSGLACPPLCAYNERMKTLTITEGRGRSSERGKVYRAVCEEPQRNRGDVSAARMAFQ